MTLSADMMEIREQDVRAGYEAATALLQGFEHAPRLAKPRAEAAADVERSPGIGGPVRRFRSTTPGLATRPAARPGRVSIVERIEGTDVGDPLTSPIQATALRSLRRAIATANAVAELYAQQTSLAALKRDNMAGRLDPARRTEFAELLSAAALITLHVFANMTAFLLADQTEVVAKKEIEIETIDEILLDNPQLALHGILWDLDQTVGQRVRDEAMLTPVIVAFAEQLMQDVAFRAGSAPRLQPFTSVTYRVEADDFQIAGFSPCLRVRSTSLTMSFKKPQEVIGNHIAKYQAMKLAKMLMAYDFERQLNPFAELGGFIFTFLGDGRPGTGKTTLIQMMAGLLVDYCAVAGYPFRYANLSIESIDSYQGKSGQNAKAFIRSVLDPHVIGFGTIDDIDQIAGRRGDRQSSAGQQEITAVLMESFAGANTVVRGNCTFGMFSNYPEMVDDALRQRASARFLVDGPRSREDYIDILHLLLGKRHDIPIGDHDLYAGQEIQKAVAASYEAHSRPQEPRLAEVFDAVRDRLGELDTIAKLGTYLKAIQQADERFTGRAIKNITDAVKVRAMDFELPDEWLENPDLFLAKDYQTKKVMIADLARPITQQMVIQEINRYADSEFRYSLTSDEAAIGNQVREMHRAAEAKTRFLAEIGKDRRE
jgi:energy-coupling factor transporter ATP-binding protein EcfA2